MSLSLLILRGSLELALLLLNRLTQQLDIGREVGLEGGKCALHLFAVHLRLTTCGNQLLSDRCGLFSRRLLVFQRLYKSQRSIKEPQRMRRLYAHLSQLLIGAVQLGLQCANASFELRLRASFGMFALEQHLLQPGA